ncbi:hypothetical protein RJ640_021561 [Escallonia rubra]|uniref:Retrotransposon gag domain-containing protein n=1 Tax=Escallonia rubra TaxID=112253 RepID=A0AA88UVL4_9ASTE|nr:hypothetical protein RJ640_021561 [Escallonia rubra]
MKLSSVDASLRDLQRGSSALYQNLTDLKFDLMNSLAQMNLKLEMPRSQLVDREETTQSQFQTGGQHNSKMSPPGYSFAQYMMRKLNTKPFGRVSWSQFVKDLYARFSSTNSSSIVGEFNHLTQTSTVDEYFNRFEALRAQLVQGLSTWMRLTLV